MSYVFEVGKYQKPLPGKINPLGEDALYTSRRCISVFDGVGSWADDGIDPRDYSAKLAEAVKEAFEEKLIQDPRRSSIMPMKVLRTLQVQVRPLYWY